MTTELRRGPAALGASVRLIDVAKPDRYDPLRDRTRLLWALLLVVGVLAFVVMLYVDAS